MPRLLHGAGLPAYLLPIAFGAALIAAGIGTNPANAQSFPCRSAHYADEKTVCQDPGLGQLDQELADVYRRVMLKLPRRDAEELDKHEDLFVAARHRCGENRACIEQSYRNRIQELQSALPEGESDRKGERRALSKGTDRQQASAPDRGTTEDERGEPSYTNRAAPEAAVSSPLRPGDQGETTAAPVLPPPLPPAEARSRRDETTSAAPNPPSRHEAEAALESVPAREKRSRHTHRTERVATTPTASDRERAPENGAAIPERHPSKGGNSASSERSSNAGASERHPSATPSAPIPEKQPATGSSTATAEAASPPEKKHSRVKHMTARTPGSGTPASGTTPSPVDQAKPASQPEIKWVNPAPSP